MVYILMIFAITYIIIQSNKIEKISLDELKLCFDYKENPALIAAIEKYAIEFVTNKRNYRNNNSLDTLYNTMETYVFMKLKQNIISYPIIYSMNNIELSNVISLILKRKHADIDLKFWKEYYSI